MKELYKMASWLLAAGMVCLSCTTEVERRQLEQAAVCSTVNPIDSTLYCTIYNFLEEVNSAEKNADLNILTVVGSTKNDTIWVSLSATPSYSLEGQYVDAFLDTTIKAYTIIRDWLVLLLLPPDMFNKYKSSFTFVNPNHYCEYTKFFDGCFEPISWEYMLQHDSLVYVKRTCH